MYRASVYACTRSSCRSVKYHGIYVSGIVGSVEAELTIGISARSAIRSKMWVDSELIEPKIAQSLSSYTIFTVWLDADPQISWVVGLLFPYTAISCQLS